MQKAKDFMDLPLGDLGWLPALLLPWYKKNARDLPWRRDREPYHIWLSEIMLQQTRVAAVRGYYLRFLEALPPIQDLARAPEDHLLKLWEGLGYYSRARNLQKAARQILSEHGGVFPQEYAKIRALPGIGDYTAGAIASICFEAPIAAVDGNVLRVVARLCDISQPMDTPAMKKWTAASLSAVYPPGCCGDFTQALMELGALCCIPGPHPLCESCPCVNFCISRQNRTQEERPLLTPKRGRRQEFYTVFILCCEGRIALCKRPGSGLLGGLWQLPNVAGTLSLEEALQKAQAWGLSPLAPEQTLKRKHIFTHLEWRMTAYRIRCAQAAPAFQWVRPEEMEQDYALPTAFRQFL